MDHKITHGLFMAITEKINSLDDQGRSDLLSEMVYELTNDRWSNNDDRMVGILEAMEVCLNMDIVN